MFVDGERVIFADEGMREVDHQMMPFVSGTALKRTSDGQYQNVEGPETRG
jgi:membrane protease subunit (stomatin/prohibitin family)